jgi:hypothetical protein
MNEIRLRAADEAERYGQGGTVSTVSWLGYDAPQLDLSVLDPSRSVAATTSPGPAPTTSTRSTTVWTPPARGTRT